MTKKAILFGSIGAVAETSDIQRRAYNTALRENGLAWEWSGETYSELLEHAGGKDRLALLSQATGAGLSEDQIEAIHARKTEVACEEVRGDAGVVRPGVEALVRLAKDRGMKLGFVTSTFRPNIDAVLASSDVLSESDFDVIVTRDDVASGKPSPDAYEYALEQLGIAASEALAIEDTANSVSAAKRAGVAVVVTPGTLTSGQDVGHADLVLESLEAGGDIDTRLVEMLG